MNAANLELCYLSGAEALAAFKARTLSPLEVLDAQIARAEAVNPQLNVITHAFFDRAREQAKRAEAAYGDNTARPLEGLTCGIKDWHPVKGEITTAGSHAFADFRPEHTAPTVERLLEAGAIMHLRTTTSELAHSGVTATPLWGISRNPWNQDYTVGGSSGGAGAVLAAGMSTLADGTDGGGSIRIPASANGVFGFKPPWGRNPLDRDHPGEVLLHYGPLTRSVADAALMQNVMSGAHPADLYTLREEIVLPTAFENINGAKIALSMDLGYFAVDPEVRENTLAAAETLRALGCTVTEIELGWNPVTVHRAFEISWETVFHALAGELLPHWRNQLKPFLADILERGARHSAVDYYAVQKMRCEMYQTLQPLLENYDALICPTLAIPAPKADHDDSDPDFAIDGKKVSAFDGWAMTYPFNILSQCPVMSVPTGFSPTSGIPTGMQIVGRTFDDRSVFRIAGAFEAATRPWASRRPKI